MKPKLLIVDDDEGIRTQLRWALTSDYEVQLAADRTTATDQFRAFRPPVVLLDLGLPPHPNTSDEGLAVLSDILALDGLAKIVIISGQGERENALQAVGSGAYDFLGKPVDYTELILRIKNLLQTRFLHRQARALQARIETRFDERTLLCFRRLRCSEIHISLHR